MHLKEATKQFQYGLCARNLIKIKKILNETQYNCRLVVEIDIFNFNINLFLTPLSIQIKDEQEFAVVLNRLNTRTQCEKLHKD